MREEFRRDFTLLGMPFSITSNYRDIIYDDEYFRGKGGFLHSLLSNFRDLQPVDDQKRPQFHVIIEDSDDEDAVINRTAPFATVSAPPFIVR